MKMKKIIMLGVGILFLAGGSYAAGKHLRPHRERYRIEIPDRPQRPPEIRGVVASVAGNSLGVQKFDKSKGPFAGKSREVIRAYMRSVSQEERKNIRSEMMASLSESVDIVVPLGTPIKIRDRSEVSDALLLELQSGNKISIWMKQEADRSFAEFLLVHMPHSPSK